MAQAQVWLITGASRGIGFEMAKTALKAGHKVVACYRTKKPSDAQNWEELEALGGLWTQLNVSDEDTESKVKAVVAQHGKIDVLVNNAGFAILGSVEDIPLDKVHDILNTNLIGTLRTIKGVLPAMRERKTGTIVNVSSSIVLGTTPALGIYTATKAALEAYTEVLQLEVAAFGLRVLLVEPGAIATEFSSETGSGIRVAQSEPYREGIVAQAAGFIPQMLTAHGASPAVMAGRIVEGIDGTGYMAGREIGLRLPLGKDVGADIEKRAGIFADLLSREDIWGSV
ncbi:hypothetical protein GGR50DRAFT_694483 [Xylaria sp. CBS 124048]|nr:hypothetical protein GGR50DRAFT_694483 [Xylaria sp. CBS 124048]